MLVITMASLLLPSSTPLQVKKRLEKLAGRKLAGPMQQPRRSCTRTSIFPDPYPISLIIDSYNITSMHPSSFHHDDEFEQMLLGTSSYSYAPSSRELKSSPLVADHDNQGLS